MKQECLYWQGKFGVQRSQSQWVVGKKSAAPQTQHLGQGERLDGEGEKHPPVDQPGVDLSQAPAAPQGKYQRGGEG